MKRMRTGCRTVSRNHNYSNSRWSSFTLSLGSTVNGLHTRASSAFGAACIRALGQRVNFMSNALLTRLSPGRLEDHSGAQAERLDSISDFRFRYILTLKHAAAAANG